MWKCKQCKSKKIIEHKKGYTCRLCKYTEFKNHYKLHEEKKVTWGMHAGKLFKDVPTEYLKWFVENAYSQMRNRKEWAIEELSRREKARYSISNQTD